MFATMLQKTRKVRFIRILIYIFCFIFVFMGCASTTTIKSRPDGATVYVDNVKIGTTPMQHSDTDIAGSTRSLKLTKEGYKPLETTIRKNELQWGPLIGGLLVFIPFIWILGYPGTYDFELEKK